MITPIYDYFPDNVQGTFTPYHRAQAGHTQSRQLGRSQARANYEGGVMWVTSVDNFKHEKKEVV